MTRREQLLVALNSIEDVDRAVLCRLSLCDRWLDRLGRGAPPTARRPSESALGRVRKQLRHFEEAAESERRRARDAGASIITRSDERYPASLLELPLPPPVLYCRGRLPSAAGVAIVGSRNADSYGLEIALMFGRHLASRGLVVVSGLALGIDSAAHRGALEAAEGRTVAVLGCGIDIEYPRGSSRLAARIARAGAVITELPTGAPPHRWHFPMRNRLIAALGSGTLVVRATPRSGSLITARQALELGRDIYALPGNIFDRRSVGPNCLIRDGALAVQHPREIVESLPSWVRDRLEPADIGKSRIAEPGEQLEEHLRDLLGRLSPGEAWTAEALADETGRSVAGVLSALLELELGGWVRRYPGATFCRRG